MKKESSAAAAFALAAAMLYAINIPFSKLLLAEVAPAMMAALLYLGAGLGLLLLGLITGERKTHTPLTKKDAPFVFGMVVLDILAPILLMLGLRKTNAATASLLNNFEITATALLAALLFKERISRRLGFAIVLVTLASVTLCFETVGVLHFSHTSPLILAAACCWGLENNCTRMLSAHSSVQITTVKGLCSGIGGLLIAFGAGETFPSVTLLPYVLLLGFVSYGLSISLYIRAQRTLGAAKTSAFFSAAPFFGVLYGVLFLREQATVQFFLGLAIMVLATVLLVRDTLDER